MSDIEIARAVKKIPIQEIGDKPGILSEDLPPFGRDKARGSGKFTRSLAGEKDEHLILLTAINPTPGEGEGETICINDAGEIDGLFQERRG